MNNFILKFILLLSIFSTAQVTVPKDSLSSIQINVLNTNYKDFISVKNSIYALTKENDLVFIDLINNKFNVIKSGVAAIAKKSNQEIIFGDNDGDIFLLKNNNKIKKIDTVDGKIFSILINSKDEYVVYTNKSIYFKKRNYVPNKETSFYGKVLAKYTGTKLIEPDFIYLDKLNFMWFSFDAGEFGGEVLFFDLNKKTFIYDNWLRLNDDVEYKDRNEYYQKLKKKYSGKINITEKDTTFQYPYQMNISSVTKGVEYDNQNNLFISSSGSENLIYSTIKGFNYFVDGTMVKISKKDTNFYKSCFDGEILVQEKYRTLFEKKIKKRSEEELALKNEILTENEVNLLGPISYNKFNNKLYLYCTKGFYSVNNINCDYSEELYFKPNITGVYYNCLNTCINVKVIKFEFISENEIIFLTQFDGIGYFDGVTLKYFK